MPTGIKTYFGTQTGLSEGTFVPCLGWAASRAKSGWHLNFRRPGESCAQQPLTGKAGHQLQFSSGCYLTAVHAAWAANWGHFSESVLRGGGGAGLCGPAWRTRPQEGLSKLRSVSFWKAGPHFRALERESGPGSAGFICIRLLITPRSLAMLTGSLCYVD